VHLRLLYSYLSHVQHRELKLLTTGRKIKWSAKTLSSFQMLQEKRLGTTDLKFKSSLLSGFVRYVNIALFLCFRYYD
jgi:hypothetical protein